MAGMTVKQNQVITEILTSLDDAATGATVDRRRRGRKAIRVPLCAVLLTSPELPRIVVHTRNMSTCGAGLVTQRSFRESELFVVHLEVPSRPGKFVLCQTVFCRYLRGGMYEVGVQFEDAVAIPPEGTRIPTRWVTKANPDASQSMLLQISAGGTSDTGTPKPPAQ